MEPVPETSEALQEFGAILFEGDLLTQIKYMGRRVRQVVPECVGLSLALREQGVTFTLVATAELMAALDGLQYLDDGPCVAAVDEARLVEFSDEDVLDEDVWQLFGRGTAAVGVASTLTLPIMVDDVVVGSVNLYADTPDAFSGKHRRVAAVLGAWPEGAITNADLGFTTRRAARDAPRLLFERTRIEVAVGILVASRGISAEEARQQLAAAARRAGVSETALARLIIEQVAGPQDDDG